jgi:atypical dual specificity phosphatase
LDTFEFETNTYLSQPILPEVWKLNNIEQKIINSRDFDAIKVEDICAGVSYIEESLEKIKKDGSYNKIYVHCKAGHGRSATLVMAYIMKHNNMDPYTAYTFVKNKRCAVNLSGPQYNSLEKYHSMIKNSQQN